MAPKFNAMQQHVNLCKTPTRMDGLDCDQYLGLGFEDDDAIIQESTQNINFIDAISCGARHTVMVGKNRSRVILM